MAVGVRERFGGMGSGIRYTNEVVGGRDEWNEGGMDRGAVRYRVNENCERARERLCYALCFKAFVVIRSLHYIIFHGGTIQPAETYRMVQRHNLYGICCCGCSSFVRSFLVLARILNGF